MTALSKRVRALEVDGQDTLSDAVRLWFGMSAQGEHGDDFTFDTKTSAIDTSGLSQEARAWLETI